MASGVGITAAQRLLKQRLKNRKLPVVQDVQGEMSETIQQIQEHFRMYEGDSRAPKERFVTIQELEQSGLIKSDVKQGFAYISRVLNKDVAQEAGSTANPTLKDPVKVDTSRQSRIAGGGGSGGSTPEKSTATVAKLGAAEDANLAKPAQNQVILYDGGKWTGVRIFDRPFTWTERQTFTKPVVLQEIDTAPDTLTQKGLLYATPTSLYFKDSGGTETDLLAAGVTTLGGLTDVTLTSPTTGDVLRYDGADWVNYPDSNFASASHVHDAADVTTGTFADARISESSVTQHEGAIDHDLLFNFVANEHIDWTNATANFLTTGTGIFGSQLSVYNGAEFRLYNTDETTYLRMLNTGTGATFDWSTGGLSTGQFLGASYWAFNRQSNAGSELRIGESTVTRGGSQNANVILYGESVSTIYSAEIENSANALRLKGGAVSPVASLEIELPTNISANVTFDALTRTIAGIENQNLVDKTANETITGSWTVEDTAGIVFKVPADADTGYVKYDGASMYIGNDRAGGNLYLDADASVTIINGANLTMTSGGLIVLNNPAQDGAMRWRSLASRGQMDLTGVLTGYDIQMDPTDTWDFLGGGDVRVRDAGALVIYDSLDSSYVTISHDADDLNIAGTSAVDINISGYTNLQLGAANIVTTGTVDGVDVSAHAADSTIHFTEASIDHTAIANIGTNTHAQIDTHIADSTIHFTKASILLDDLGDVTETTITTGDLLRWNGTAWVNYADSNYASSGHTHLLAAGATDVTATAAEVNLLDLAALTTGNVLSADSATTASWKAPEIVYDLSPQLGGDLASNGNNILMAANDFIRFSDGVDTAQLYADSVSGNLEWAVTGGFGLMDFGSLSVRMNNLYMYDTSYIRSASESSHELVGFDGVPSAVNYLEIANAITTAGPELRAAGSDANIDLELVPKGTGVVRTTAGLDVTGNIVVSGLVDGKDVAAHVDDSTIHFTQGAISIPLSQISDVTATAAEVNLLDLSGLTAGWVLRASGAATAAWAQLAHSDLSGVGTNTHTQIDTHIADSTIHFTKGSILLDELGDVVETTITTGDLLRWNGTNWVNYADSNYQPAGTYNTTIGTDTDLVTSGFTVVDDITLTDGVITAHTTRALDRLSIFDNRAAGDVLPNALPSKTAYFTFTDDITGSSNAWDAVINMSGWSVGSYTSWQIIGSADTSYNADDPLYLRFAATASTWGNLRQFITQNNNGDVPLPADASLFIDQKASAATDITDAGQFWVRDTAPNLPYFTDDTGLDRFLNPEVAELQYKYDTETLNGVGTASGEVRFNSATPASVSTMWISETDYAGRSQVGLLNNVSIGDTVLIKQGNSDTMYFRARIGSVTDSGTYMSYALTVDANGSTMPSQDEPVHVSFYPTASAALPTGTTEDAVLTWDNTGGQWVENTVLRVDTGVNGVRIYQNGTNDHVEFYHDGNDLLVTNANTATMAFVDLHLELRDVVNLQFGSAGDIRMNWDSVDLEMTSLLADWAWQIRDGVKLTLWDGTDADSAEFHHDGTDFNTDFVTTADWNIVGLTNFQIEDAALRITDTLDTIYFEIDSQTTETLFTSSGASRGLWIRTGQHVRIYDDTNSDYVEFHHDATDFNMEFFQTTDFNINDGVTVKLWGDGSSNAPALFIYDATNTDSIQINHSGTVATIFVDNAASLDFVGDSGTEWNFRDGGELRVYNTGDDDYMAFSHDGTKGIIKTEAGAGDVVIMSNGADVFQGQDHNATGNSTGAQVKAHNGTFYDVGLNVMPVYEIDANDSFDVDHASMIWHKDLNATVTFTCENTSDAPNGTTWVVFNDDTEDLTIAQGTGVTVYWLEPGAAPAAGNVTLKQGGIVTVYKYTNTEYWVWGAKEAGGGGGINNVVEDTTPQLGGDLDLQTFAIVTSSNATTGEIVETTTAGSFRIQNGTQWADIGPRNSSYTHFDTNASAGFYFYDNVTTAGNFELLDNGQLHLGSGDDISLYFNGTNFFIDQVGTGNMEIRLNTTERVIFAEYNAGAPRVSLYYNNGIQFRTQNRTTGITSGCEVVSHDGAWKDVGFNTLDVETEDVSDTLEAKHCGGVYFKDGTTAITLTLEASGSTDFPVGGITHIINANTTGNITVNEGASTTLYYLSGSTRTDTAGGCTVGPGGIATLWREATTIYYIWGSGITP